MLKLAQCDGGVSLRETGNMADQEAGKPRDLYKQSVILQRSESADDSGAQVMRRRSLAIAHLYLSSASLSRTRTRSLTRDASVQTSQETDSGSESDISRFDQRPCLPQRPQSEYPADRPGRSLSLTHPEAVRPSVVSDSPAVTRWARTMFDRPSSEFRRPLLEYRDVIVRDSDKKRVVPRRPKSEWGQPARNRDTSSGASTDPKVNISRTKRKC